MRPIYYQSPIARWKPAVLILAWLSAGALPYEDTRQRFSLTLPDGWRLAPRFGDLYGTSFERPLGGTTGGAASLTVHADPFSAADLDAFADQVERQWSAAGSRRIRAAKAEVAGRPAMLRESELSDNAGRRLARSYCLEANGRWFHLRFEVPGSSMRLLDQDLRQVLKSFKPGSAPKDLAAEEPTLGPDPRFLGRWEGAQGAILELARDGRFTLAGRAGKYTLTGSTLTLEIPGKSAVAFALQLGDGGQSLTLKSASLPAPQVYRRPDAAKDAAPANLVGRWSASGPRGDLVLSLLADGTFHLGPMSGLWQSDEDRLALRGSRGEAVIYRFELNTAGLHLSGGDLEAALLFRRTADE